MKMKSQMAKGFSVIKNSPPAMPDHMGNMAPEKGMMKGGEMFPVGRKDRTIHSGLAGDAAHS